MIELNWSRLPGRGMWMARMDADGRSYDIYLAGERGYWKWHIAKTGVPTVDGLLLGGSSSSQAGAKLDAAWGFTSIVEAARAATKGGAA